MIHDVAIFLTSSITPFLRTFLPYSTSWIKLLISSWPKSGPKDHSSIFCFSKIITLSQQKEPFFNICSFLCTLQKTLEVCSPVLKNISTFFFWKEEEVKKKRKGSSYWSGRWLGDIIQNKRNEHWSNKIPVHREAEINWVVTALYLFKLKSF